MRRLRTALVEQVSVALTAARVFARADLAAADEDVRLAKADLARARRAAAVASSGPTGAPAPAEGTPAAAYAPESHAPESFDMDAATGALRAVTEAAWAAAKRCAYVDTRAERTWAELYAYLGRRGRRLGPLPSPGADLTFGGTPAPRSARATATARSARPDNATAGSARAVIATAGSARADNATAGSARADNATAGSARAAVSALDRASDTIARCARGEPIGTVPGWALALLPLLGAACAAMVSYPMRVLSSAAHGVSVLGAVAQILLLVAPFGGLPPAAWWVRDRFGCPPDGGVLGLTALGGMIAACATAFM